ncbi:hypothetical protein Tco_0294897 [Tanacetum coccineum]
MRELRESTFLREQRRGCSRSHLIGSSASLAYSIFSEIEQLTEELRSRKEKSKQAKVVIVEHEGPSSPKQLKNLHGISLLSDSQEENTNDQLPTKESNPGYFTLPCTIEDEEKIELGSEDYNPPMVHTFEVTKYKFDNGCSFICVNGENNETLSLGRKNGSRFRKMIMEEMEEVRGNDKEDSDDEM